jgi:hypothetical protein
MELATQSEVAALQSQLDAIRAQLAVRDELAASPKQEPTPADVTWVLITTTLVFLMQLGFAMVHVPAATPEALSTRVAPRRFIWAAG